MTRKLATTGKKLANATSFKPGAEWHGNASGRPRGSRNKLSAEFVAAMCQDFEKSGAAVIAKVRDEKPEAYLRIIASLVPQQVELGGANEFERLTDAELDAFIEASMAQFKAKATLQ